MQPLTRISLIICARNNSDEELDYVKFTTLPGAYVWNTLLLFVVDLKHNN